MSTPKIGFAIRRAWRASALRLAFGIAAFVLPLSEARVASAAVCAAGAYRAGCVTRHGAVVTTRPATHRHCYWRNGVRVCR